MTKDEKEVISSDLKSMCMFLDEIVCSLFSDDIINNVPVDQQPILKRYKEGLSQVKRHISSEYEAVMIGAV